jgi:two-component system phosphate regulon sensor histidine kinase PhoR
MNLPISWKVALGALLAVTSGLAVAGWLALRSVEGHELARTTESLDARAGLASLSLRFTSTADLQSLSRELSRQARARVTIIRPDGKVLADSDTPDAGLSQLESHGTRPEVIEAVTSGQGTDIRLSQTTGQRMFYLARVIAPPDVPETTIIRLSLPLTVLDNRINDLQRAIGLAFGVAFVISVAFSILIARGLTRPLSEMATVARQLAQGALGRRIQTRSRNEVGILAETLNQMADQLETKIREVSEDRAQLLAILGSMVEGIMVLDARGRILQVNRALERMFALRSDDVKGHLHSEVIRHHELNALTSRVLEMREGMSGEIQLDPSRRALRVEASTVSGGVEDNKACIVLVFYDVTALRRLEQVRKDFVANVSHELRTPLTSIKGYVEALLDGGKDDPTEAVHYLDVILKQSDRLNLLLEDLLQLSQIESGQVAFKRDPVRLQAVAERTLALIQPLADKKGHTLTVSFPHNLPPVIGDEGRLVQVLTNLLDNAVKYTPSRGSISVTARYLPPEVGGAANGMVELLVVDTGLGIPESDRPRVFERFYRVDKARSRELGGTGLGLAIVKHIVEGHGGQIWVEGNQPMGSRFIVRLPADELPANGAPDQNIHMTRDKII